MNPFKSRLQNTDKEGLDESSTALFAIAHTCNKPQSLPSFLLVHLLLVAIYCHSLGRQIKNSFFKILPRSISCVVCLLEEAGCNIFFHNCTAGAQNSTIRDSQESLAQEEIHSKLLRLHAELKGSVENSLKSM